MPEGSGGPAFVGRCSAPEVTCSIVCHSSLARSGHVMTPRYKGLRRSSPALCPERRYLPIVTTVPRILPVSGLCFLSSVTHSRRGSMWLWYPHHACLCWTSSFHPAALNVLWCGCARQYPASPVWGHAFCVSSLVDWPQWISLGQEWYLPVAFFPQDSILGVGLLG